MTKDPGENLEDRVLVVAPVGKDAHLISDALGRAGIAALTCRTLGDLCRELAAGAGAVVLMEEAFDGRPQPLFAAIDGQPSWSDLPVIVCYGKVNRPTT